MTESTRIVDELSRAIDGDPWHGDPIATILRDVTPAIASTRATPTAHTIWELVRHITAWTNEAARRIDGHAAGEPLEGDWPAPTGTGATEWQRDVDALHHAHRQLLTRIAPLSDADLLAPTNDPRNRATGSGVSRYVLLHGLAQHHAYHAGQISLLKKMVAAEVSTR